MSKLPITNYHLLITGQSMIELLVALGVFVISLAAGFQLFFGGQSLSVDSANVGLASDYGQESVEAVRTIRDRSWAELTDGDHGLTFNGAQWAFSGVNDGKDIFTRVVSVKTISENLKIATTTITWQTDPLRTQKVELVEQFANWQNPSQGSCKAGPLSGNWASPQVLGTGDLGAGNEGTDIAVKLPYVYISGKASASSKPDIFVFNVTNPASPVLSASLNIGADGINAIFVKGNYLYAASSNDSKEFIVFDISIPASISEVASLNLSGNDDSLSIHGLGNAVYVGRKESSQPELVVIDVSSPSSPTITASIEAVDDVNDLVATSQRLYMVNEESNNDLRIYDITNPLSPQLLTGYNMTQGGELTSVWFQDPGNVLVGDHANEFFVLGATTTSQIYIRDSLVVGGGVNDIVCVSNQLSFVSTTNSTKEFIIVNIADPDNITEYASLNFPQNGTGIDFADNKIFMSVRSNDALRIITSGP